LHARGGTRISGTTDTKHGNSQASLYY